ncbi:hypothetical protein RB195_016287 [Necator americanus]|uniref:Uncharacterized protein n=1 Tax=Necator americanus TaxID=51031 RepID=A0ABR1E9H5_NECAM
MKSFGTTTSTKFYLLHVDILCFYFQNYCRHQRLNYLELICRTENYCEDVHRWLKFGKKSSFFGRQTPEWENGKVSPSK